MRITDAVRNLAALVALCACSRDPVSWSDVRYSLAAGTGLSTAQSEDSGAIEHRGYSAAAIPDAAACRASIRLARSGKSFFAVWWSARPDSSAALLASRSDDGGPWVIPVAADTTDAGRRGCSRPAPSIAADIGTGYVHLAYFIEPSSGAGVFSSHSMDRDSSFHSAVAMVYGSRPSNTAIAAQGERVVVAYEDPNSPRPRIFVALSQTMGHIFEARLPVSAENAAAADPDVRLRGTKLVVSWDERTSEDSAVARHASRTGIWK